MSSKVWDEITYPFLNSKLHNGCNYLAILVLKLAHVSKRRPRPYHVSNVAFLSTRPHSFYCPWWSMDNGVYNEGHQFSKSLLTIYLTFRQLLIITSNNFRVVPSSTTRINTCSTGRPINWLVRLIIVKPFLNIHDIYKMGTKSVLYFQIFN